MKYLKVSDRLIAATAKFWIDYWRNESPDETYFVCYYIDGNTKALWSSNRCYKGRVTMLGRVMNCLENVFIHDGKGHPLYFQTFQGHADLGKHALSMLTKLAELLDDPSTHITVKRILVMGGGGNGVKTLRAFEDSDEYYITILDDNQTNERKFKHIREEIEYKYGNLAKCMDHEKFELQTLFESIFQLNGEAFITNEEKRIELEMNPKEPELMNKLNKGLRILNTMNIRDSDGHSIRFNM
ncbi:MAG: hypothetical protein K8R25_11115 [Methanosarcinales archaeon]|nr:hypothetical protein [Methanosarcinales archaeon]